MDVQLTRIVHTDDDAFSDGFNLPADSATICSSIALHCALLVLLAVARGLTLGPVLQTPTDADCPHLTTEVCDTRLVIQCSTPLFRFSTSQNRRRSKLHWLARRTQACTGCAPWFFGAFACSGRSLQRRSTALFLADCAVLAWHTRFAFRRVVLRELCSTGIRMMFESHPVTNVDRTSFNFLFEDFLSNLPL